MEKVKKFDLAILNDYLERGLLEKNDHPSLPISIWNYSRQCQYSQSWDEITLNMRGTILDAEGNIVAFAFPKFFNYEEVVKEVPVKGDYVYVQDKMDGSLGILFWYEGEWHLATKGSFTLDQAIKGMQILQDNFSMERFHKHITYIIEIIYPENRIVVDYEGDEKCVFLTTSFGGIELDWEQSYEIFKDSGIDEKYIVKTEKHFSFGADLYENLKLLNTPNAEGFILRFHPQNFRIKIKFEEYVRLHKLLTSFSNVDIWEYLKEGKDLNFLLEQVPDEFDLWVKGIIKRLKNAYEDLEKKAIVILDELDKGLTRKEIAQQLMDKDPVLRPIVFNMLDGKSYAKIIWKNLRPSYQKPFWQREE